MQPSTNKSGSRVQPATDTECFELAHITLKMKTLEETNRKWKKNSLAERVQHCPFN